MPATTNTGSAGRTKPTPGPEERASWTNPLETVELTSDEELHEFCEIGRQFSRYLAVITSLGAAELKEALESMSGGGHWAAFGFDSRMRARKVAKHLEKAAEAFEDASAQFYATWLAFEKEFAEAIESAGAAKRKKSFTIGGM